MPDPSLILLGVVSVSVALNISNSMYKLCGKLVYWTRRKMYHSITVTLSQNSPLFALLVHKISDQCKKKKNCTMISLPVDQTNKRKQFYVLSKNDTTVYLEQLKVHVKCIYESNIITGLELYSRKRENIDNLISRAMKYYPSSKDK
jgi:hypothetical protein